MPSPNNDKNNEYQARHRKTTREQMGEEAYKKMESEARKLRRQKAKAKAQPQIDMNALANFTSLRPLDINHLMTLAPQPQQPRPQQKKRGRKPKPAEEVNDNMTYKEKRRIYIRNYMREYRNKN
jgi:hypothetical protein